MKRVEIFKTEDGRFFESRAEAERHEEIHELAEWYEENKLYGNYDGCRIDWLDFLSWLEENKTKVREILSLF